MSTTSLPTSTRPWTPRSRLCRSKALEGRHLPPFFCCVGQILPCGTTTIAGKVLTKAQVIALPPAPSTGHPMVSIADYVAFTRHQARFLGFGSLLAFMSSAGQTYFIGVFDPEIQATFSLSHTQWGGLYGFPSWATESRRHAQFLSSAERLHSGRIHHYQHRTRA